MPQNSICGHPEGAFARSAERNLYVALPPEVWVPGMCVRSFSLKAVGGHGIFQRGLTSPCRYRHSSKDLSCVVHGDDFVLVGVDSDLEWARQQMEKSIVKVICRLGGDKQDVLELRALDRVLSWRS